MCLQIGDAYWHTSEDDGEFTRSESIHWRWLWVAEKTQEPRIDLTTSSSPSASAPTMWIAHLHLTAEDRDVVGNGWLNDRVMDSVNQLLSSQLGGQPQSTLMSQSLTCFTAQQQDTVMILHTPNHWVTVAATEGEVIYV